MFMTFKKNRGHLLGEGPVLGAREQREHAQGVGEGNYTPMYDP